MERRRLGAHGPEVGAIGLGCMPMSGAYSGRSPDDPIRVIRHAFDLGVTLFDTADVYGPFTNEELLGRALEGRDAVIATKVGMRIRQDGGHGFVNDARGERILGEVDGSLRRLRTEVIDLYYLHRVDPEVPFEEQWGAMVSLVQAGKVRAIGLSEVTVEHLERASAIHPVAAVESELSLWSRDPLDEIVPWCRQHGAAFVAFAPLGRGYLTGAVTSAGFDSSDHRATKPRFTPEAIEANRPIVEIIRGVAERHGATPAQVAIAWVLDRGEHVIPIPGTKRVPYLEENLAATSLDLTPRDLAELDAAPRPVGSRY